MLSNLNFIKSKYYYLKKTKDPEVGSYIQHVRSLNKQLAYCLRIDHEKEKGTETELIADIRNKSEEVNHPIIKNYLFSLLIKHSTLF